MSASSTSTPPSTQIKRQQLFNLLTQIPLGKVATYGQLAKLAGIKNPRQVGALLHTNTDDQTYPCHRVIRSDGSIATGYAFGEQHGQIIRLRHEGVEVRGGKVDLGRYQWQPE